MKVCKQILIAMGFIASVHSYAQVAECDRLAASPQDPQKQSAGVGYERLNAGLAVSACKVAISESPKVGRLWFQYGRALEKANKLPDEISAYQEAAKLNSGVAYNNLGELYRDGKGFQKDLKKAEELFAKSAELNSPEGRDNLAGLRKKSQNQIPNNLRGEWSESKGSCRSGDVSISEDVIYISFMETICLIKEVTDSSATGMTGKFYCKTAVAADVPYPKTTKNLSFKLSGDGKMSSSNFGNDNKPLMRCK